MRFRIAVGRFCTSLVDAVLSIESGFVSGAREEPAGRVVHPPNARLFLVSARDLRRPASARIADSIESSRWALYFTGVRVVVDASADPITLHRASGSAIDTLRWTDRQRHRVASGRWGRDGPVLGLDLDRP